MCGGWTKTSWTSLLLLGFEKNQADLLAMDFCLRWTALSGFVNGGDCKGNITPKCPLRYLYIGFGKNSNLPRTRWMVRWFFSPKTYPPSNLVKWSRTRTAHIFRMGWWKTLDSFWTMISWQVEKKHQSSVVFGLFQRLVVGLWISQNGPESRVQQVKGRCFLQTSGLRKQSKCKWYIWPMYYELSILIHRNLLQSLNRNYHVFIFQLWSWNQKWKQVGRCLHVSEAPWLLHLGCTCLGAWRSKSSKSLGGSFKKVPSRHGRQM